MKVEKNVVMLAPESCESEQNWLSYDFFKKTCSSGGDDTWTKSCTRTPFFLKNHNLISFAHIHMILVPTRPHFSLLSPYVLTKKIKRLGIVPGTWFDEKGDLITWNGSFHEKLYTVRFVWMRRIQRYHFHYVIRVGRQSPQANTAFLILHYDRDAGVT